MRKTFEEWMREVDRLVEAFCGLSTDDLPDICYMDMYEDGATPKEAYRAVMQEA